MTYGHKRSYDKEISDYGEAITLDPNFAAAYVSRGTAYGKKNRTCE